MPPLFIGFSSSLPGLTRIRALAASTSPTALWNRPS